MKRMISTSIWTPSLSLASLFAASTALAVDPSVTRTGTGAGAAITTGVGDTATGYNSMNKTTTGSENTATGRNALFYATTANGNTATGSGALFGQLNASTGGFNTAEGFYALHNNTSGTPRRSTTGLDGDLF